MGCKSIECKDSQSEYNPPDCVIEFGLISKT